MSISTGIDIKTSRAAQPTSNEPETLCELCCCVGGVLQMETVGHSDCTSGSARSHGIGESDSRMRIADTEEAQQKTDAGEYTPSCEAEEQSYISRLNAPG